MEGCGRVRNERHGCLKVWEGLWRHDIFRIEWDLPDKTKATNQPSLLRTFVFIAISTYDSYLSKIFGTNALIWDFFHCLEGLFLRPLRSKDVQGWILRLRPPNFLASSENLAPLYDKRYQSSDFLSFFSSKTCKKSNKSELRNLLSYICLTFSRLVATLSDRVKQFRGWSLKIQPWTSFDLNGLKKSPSKHFESSLKLIHLFQRLMGAMNCR